MDKIRVLSDGVANQIAAGEVVGRPASVVKELMENAVDAGSSSITVNFKDGGRTLIQVVDNGCGMSENDARLAFERHATSKIQTTEDLYSLSTFGFRGEALPSIASVSETELRTRPCDREWGTRLVIQGGVFVEQSPVEAPQGTQLLVKNLFYNVPARRKFLKEPHVEARHLTAEFQRVALCNPHIAFSLYNNDNPVYTLPAANLRQRIAGVHGKSLANNLLEVSVDTSIVRIEGFVGHPSVARKTSKEQYFFVNGRYFRSPYFHKAVLKAYEKVIAPETQPPYFLYLTLDADRIDVNVHPSKTEIKFDDEQAMWQILNAAVRESLGKLGVIPLMDFEMDPSLDIPVYREGTPFKMPETVTNPDFNPFVEERQEKSMPRSFSSPHGVASGAPKGWESLYEMESSVMPESDPIPERTDERKGFEDVFSEEVDPSLIEFIDEGASEPMQGMLEMETERVSGGLLRLTDRLYATSWEENLVVVDVERARERVMYERYMRMLGNNAAVSQQLLFPERIELAADDMEVLRSMSEELQTLGFEFRFDGNDTVEITGVSPDLSVGQLEDMLRELIGRFRENTDSPRQERLQRLASWMAHRGGSASQSWSEEAVKALLEELFECENRNYTPQGQPVVVWISSVELAQRFKS